MIADGIHYENLLKIASPQEVIELCSSGVSEILNHLRQHDSLSDSEIHQIAKECIDFPAIAKNPDGIGKMIRLIKRQYENQGSNIIQRFADYLNDASLNNIDEEDLQKHLVKKPDDLLRFIKYTWPGRDTEEETDFSEQPKVINISPKNGLRYYQLHAVRSIIGKLSQDPYNAMYHAPTGSGKTKTAMAVITQHLRMHGPTAVLWLASSSELVSQAAQAFKTAWEYHGDTSCTLRLWHENSPDFKPEHEPKRNNMLIAGLQKVAHALRKDDKLIKKLQAIISLIVFDEAHQSIAPTYRQIIEGIREENKCCKLLGLSATPGRSDIDETDDLISLYSGNRIPFWHPGDTANPIEYLVKEHYLAKAQFHPIEHQATDEKTADHADIIRKIMRALEDAKERGHKRILVFSPSVDSARICSAILKSRYAVGASYILSSNTPKDIRKKLLDRYSDNTSPALHVIFNYGILTTGFDAPCTSAVVIARNTDSVGLYSQMVGRAIRGKKSNGNDNADIYTIVDTSNPEFASVAKAFDNWNQQWKDNKHASTK